MSLSLGFLSRLTSKSDGVLEQLSPNELDEFGEAFLIFDKDSSGTISIDELGDAMRALGQNPTEQVSRTTFVYLW